MKLFEKLDKFFLGQESDINARQMKDDLLLDDAGDLVPHAVCAGMAGRIFKEGKNAAQPRETLMERQPKLAAETDSIASPIDPSVEKLETKPVKPKGMDISVSLVTLVCTPYLDNGRGGSGKTYQI